MLWKNKPRVIRQCANMCECAKTSSTGSSDSDHTLGRSALRGVPRTRWQAIAGARKGPKVNIINAPSYTNEV